MGSSIRKVKHKPAVHGVTSSVSDVLWVRLKGFLSSEAMEMAEAEANGVEVIELNRGEAGKSLGFNIRGGVDMPHVEGDPGIFITKIREGGAAALDGRLQEGDKVLEINGTCIESVNHQEAVRLFLESGDIVRLKVLPGAERAILERDGSIIRTGKSSGQSQVLWWLGGAAAVTVIAVYTFYRFRYRH
ncbi:synaptojanin-2-binding protein-like isoform X1 [Branchiostoma floridae]|uniref:Synaptojanin-2-binding protein-like isoform X1 n=1 Tax=Branchiostoma floridae TaxID=7739 RepID=A0A9J7LKU6_BRAFL|nr:synaptojanin-2-binding protein-like isoform X1 [Branchiostoma floridae]